MRNLLIILMVVVQLPVLGQNLERHTKVVKLMGSRFEITAIHENPQVAWDAINAGITEITRIEKLISSWDPNSQTSEVIRQAGIQPVEVYKELFDLINRALQISRITDGAFDISYASMDKIWKFDGSMTEMPSADIVANAAAKIDYKNILLNSYNQTVFLKERGMKIGFGAIGKGYAAQKAKEVMSGMGIRNGVVNASGDLIAWGKNEKGELFQVGIADPKNKDQVLSWLNVENTSVVTSGDYERFVMFDKVRYAHIIDPRTGYPTTGIKSVTIITANPELADALSTSVFVLGVEKGIAFVNQLPGVECLIITDQDQIKTSENLSLNDKS